MWIDARGHRERGHVVEGGRAYATVLREDGARLRIRWESLLVEDRAPLRTIVTDLDRAQVRFEVSDDVVFTTRRARETGALRVPRAGGHVRPGVPNLRDGAPHRATGFGP